MLPFAHPATQNPVQTLREGIKAKYSTYHLRNKDQYPDFAFNSNRANYQPLKDSFEEEFYEVRKIDRASPNVYVPSTNTLALLFTDETYVPSIKILNTCQSYALGPANPAVLPDVPTLHQPKLPQPSRVNWRLIIGLVILFCLGAFIYAEYASVGPSPSELVINRPAQGSRVPQEVIIDGKAANAKTVWIGVRAKASGLVWIQPPILVQDNGNWIGVIYIGGLSKGDEGRPCQIRVFLNPFTKLTSGDVLEGWPEAERYSNIIDVVRERTHH